MLYAAVDGRVCVGGQEACGLLPIAVLDVVDGSDIHFHVVLAG